MDYRKLIKEEIAKLHTAKGVKVNPKLDSDLGEQIVADICRKIVKNCSIPTVAGQSEQLVCDCGNPNLTWYGNDDDKTYFCFECKKEVTK